MKLFGRAGQDKINSTRVAVAGVGGLGSHVVQQLAYLGVQELALIDDDVVEVSNLNRLIGATPEDAEQHRPKVEVAYRLVQAIRPDAELTVLPTQLADAVEAVKSADVIVGCLDNDSARLTLTDLSSRYAIPYIDLASDAGEEDGFLWYGGRVVVSHDGRRCLSCCGELDQRALAVASMNAHQREADQAIYGVDRAVLGAAGPSVVSINGVVASLGVTEFLALVAGLRDPIGQLVYYGNRSIVTTRQEPPAGNCYYCSTLFGSERR